MCQFSCLNLNILGRESAFIHLINFIDDSPYYLLTRCLNSFPQKQFYSFLLFCQDRVLSRPWFVAIFVGISFFRVSPLSASLNLRLQASQTHFKGNIWWRVKSRSDAKCWCCWLNSDSLKFCPEIAKCKLHFFFIQSRFYFLSKSFQQSIVLPTLNDTTALILLFCARSDDTDWSCVWSLWAMTLRVYRGDSSDRWGHYESKWEPQGEWLVAEVEVFVDAPHQRS